MNNNINPSPFLRWAGGKTWLIKFWDEIVRDMNFNSYIEPFLGGGAIYFSIFNKHKSILSDLNPELINAYNIVKNKPEELIEILLSYENTKESYYEIRGKKSDSDIEKAAIFIYLNQTSYNGLYRVNKKGEYNVPYGNRKKDINIEKIRNASVALKDTLLMDGDFTKTLEFVNKGDLVFLDPPYTVSHNSNGFIKYNRNLFSLDDQYRLSEYIDRVKEKGAYYILTNAAHETVKDIFNKGDKIYELERSSVIGGKNSNRGLISEYVFTNIKNEV